MESLKNGYFGLIGERTNPLSYELVGGIQILPSAKNTFQENNILYNQGEVAPNCCSIHGALGAFSDLTGYKFSLSERKALWDSALSQGASPMSGWYVDSAVDLIRKYANDNLKLGRFNTIQLVNGSDQFWEALEKGYSITTGYRGTMEYNTDMMDNGIIDKIDIGKIVYGHCIRICKITSDVVITNPTLAQIEDYLRLSGLQVNEENISIYSKSVPTADRYVIDNYKDCGADWKEKYIVKADMIELVKNNIFFYYGFIFMYEEDIGELDIDYKFAIRYAHNLIMDVTTGSLYMVDKDGNKVSLDNLGNGSESSKELIYELKKKMLDNAIPLGMDQKNINKFKTLII